jgi:subtilisin family serine protease
MCIAGLSTVDGRSATAITIHLRRAPIDPLRTAAIRASDMQTTTPTRLLLVQFSTAPDMNTRAALEATGLHPLLYIPDNTFLVRASQPVIPASVVLPGLRWAGPFQATYKLPAELDSLVSSTDPQPADLRLLAMPDADVDALAQALRGLGGAVLEHSSSLNGTSLHVVLPAAALRAVLQRDDVLWLEAFVAPGLYNDRAGRILGVPAARVQFGLTGAGQIVAVTDTGLDVQSNLSADFAGRLVRGFSTNDMSSACSGTTWNDRNGHGTHVSGTVLGSGTLSPSGFSFAGMAPAARLIIQAVSSGGRSLDCLPYDTSYLSKAYAAGARVQNASWGGPTGAGACEFGCYTDQARDVDSYLWDHKDHLFVVAAGNSGIDIDDNGVIDPDSIGSPAIAKNVLAIGATENDRPPTSGGCSSSSLPNLCWSAYGYGTPFAGDFVSDHINGMAAFSSRGPADDGRIKPEIVAPGVNIISARSHDPAAAYGSDELYGNDYAYKSGTSMATPMISGLAALVRQWLAEQRHIDVPSAALVKALLINGATDITPGQYKSGPQREIPMAWPNSVEGWGRAAITDTIGLSAADQVWMHEGDGLQTGMTVTYTLDISAGQALRFTLAWTDYPGNPAVDKQLVNDLDLEVQAPDSTITRGNANGDLRLDCRDAGGYDRCNNVESVQLAAPVAGRYMVRVHANVVNPLGGPQPFALVGRAQHILNASAPEKLFLPMINR